MPTSPATASQPFFFAYGLTWAWWASRPSVCAARRWSCWPLLSRAPDVGAQRRRLRHTSRLPWPPPLMPLLRWRPPDDSGGAA